MAFGQNYYLELQLKLMHRFLFLFEMCGINNHLIKH